MDDLNRILEEDKVIVETGDMLCFHTGYGNYGDSALSSLRITVTVH
jgi:hypothetical protein